MGLVLLPYLDPKKSGACIKQSYYNYNGAEKARFLRVQVTIRAGLRGIYV